MFKRAESTLTADEKLLMVQKTKKLLNHIMIARNVDTVWWDEPIVVLRPHDEEIVDCPLAINFADRINKHDEGIRSDMIRENKAAMAKWVASGERGTEPTLHAFQYVQRHFKTRQYAVFPELQDVAQQYNLKLTMQELSKGDWLSNPSKSPYARHLRQLTVSSTKLQKVRQIIGQLKANVDGTGEPEKLVIVSCHPVVAFIVFLWAQTLEVGPVAFYHASLRFKARQQIADAFEERKTADGKYVVESNRPRILVGTAGVMGVGLNLKRAGQIILMEPHYLKRDERQAIARIKRIGQLNNSTKAWRLRDLSLRVEEAILARQEGRAVFQDQVMR